MKILYLTRNFNHSGYLILDKLLEEKFNIIGVIIKKEFSFLTIPLIRMIFILFYKIKCIYYNCKPLKTLNSEEILAKKKRGVAVIKTNSVKTNDFYEKLKKLDPDIIVIGGGWHELIPDRVFLYPKLGCINTHPSLLPEFRGTSITRWQIFHQIEKSGTTIHYVDDKFDTGGILVQKEIFLNYDITPQELFYRLGEIGSEIMPSLLRKIDKFGSQEPIDIEHNQKYYKYFKKWIWSIESLSIDWHLDFKSIHFFVLANIQESYQYLGPIFQYKENKYFLRVTRIHRIDSFEYSRKLVDNIGENEIIVLDIKKGSVFLFRKEENYILELKQIQKYDKYYKFRRGKKANTLLKLKKGQKIDIK